MVGIFTYRHKTVFINKSQKGVVGIVLDKISIKLTKRNQRQLKKKKKTFYKPSEFIFFPFEDLVYVGKKLSPSLSHSVILNQRENRFFFLNLNSQGSIAA